MRRARFEGTAPWLWLLAVVLATLFLFLDPTWRSEIQEEAPPSSPGGDPRFFELPALPPPGSDAGVRAPSRR